MFKKEEMTFPLNIQLFGDDNPPANPEEGNPSGGEKTFTQAEVDQMIKDRLKREGKGEPKTALSEPKVTEPKEKEVDNSVNEAMVQNYLTAELKFSMTQEGVDPSKVARAVRLIDASKLADDEGIFSSEKASAEIKELLKEWPELKTQSTDGAGGFKVGSGGGTGKSASDDEIAKAFGNT